LLALIVTIQGFSNQNEKQITVYAFPKSSLLEFRSGRQLVMYSDSTFSVDPGIKNICSNTINGEVLMMLWKYHGIIVILLQQSPAENYYSITKIISSFRIFKMVRVCNPLQHETPERKLKVDAILISQNPKISLTQLLQFLRLFVDHSRRNE